MTVLKSLWLASWPFSIWYWSRGTLLFAKNKKDLSRNLQGGLALVVMGGKEHDGNALSSVLLLLPKATAWTSLTSLPHPLTSATASIVGDRLRVIGGMFNGESQDEVCSFCQRESIKNDNTGSWVSALKKFVVVVGKTPNGKIRSQQPFCRSRKSALFRSR